MPSEIKIMDQTSLSPSSYFYDDILFPADRQVGFWKPETMSGHHQGVGKEVISRIPGSKSMSPSPVEKFISVGMPSEESLEFSQPFLARNQNTRFSVERLVVGAERTSSNVPVTSSWRENNIGMRPNMFVHPASYVVHGNKVGMGAQCEGGMFSSSLSEIFSKKLRLSSNGVPFGQSVDNVTSHYEEEPFQSLEELEARTIGNLLPDDDDLLSGMIDDLDYITKPSSNDELEEFDLFSSGGGMELEGDDQRSAEFAEQGLNAATAGEHPFGEHPSRTLFVRNINSNIEDSELKVLFEQYGDIRTLYTACKHRGFVMISYYDIRAARNAMRALQNKPLRRRKLDIHFSIPKDNPSEKDINQGTLVVFNLDFSVSNDDLRQIFGVYGEIKEIRETPHKRHHKFIEFYDVRAADAALRALNRSDIAGKRIKLEPSRPGGARRCVMQQLFPELEDETNGGQRQGSPPDSSPTRCFDSPGLITSNGMDNGAVQGLHSAIRTPISQFVENGFHHGMSSSVPQSLHSPVRVASVGNQSGLGEPSPSLGPMEFGFRGMTGFHPHSLPEYHDSLANGSPYNSSTTLAAMTANIGSITSEELDNRHMRRVASNSHSMDLNEGIFGSAGNGSRSLHNHPYMWSNSNSNSFNPHSPNPMMWPNSPSFVNGVHAHPPQQMHGLPRLPSHMLNSVLPSIHHQHVGSAPTMNHSVWDRRHAYAGESPETSGFHPGSLGNMGFHPMELASHNIFPRVGGNRMDPTVASTDVGLHSSPQQRCHIFPSRNPMIHLANSFDASNERVRIRRNESSSNQGDNKQYELDIDRHFSSLREEMKESGVHLLFTLFILRLLFLLTIFTKQVISSTPWPHNQHPHHVKQISNDKDLDFGSSKKYEGSSEFVHLKYHMGPVLTSTITVHPIWYGTWENSQKKIIREFLNSISSSDSKHPSVSGWWKTVQLYTDQTGANISRAVHVGEEKNDRFYSHGRSLTRLSIQSVIKSAVSVRTKPLPINPKSGLYLLLTAADVHVEDFCGQVCGFHYFTFPSIVGYTLPYAWVGNSEKLCPGVCAYPFAVPDYIPNLKPLKSPNGDIGIDGMISVIGHEIAELATNPLVNAWYAGPDPSFPTEIADLCEGIYGTGGGGSYTGQMLKGHDGATFNMDGIRRRFLVQWIWNPILNYCSGPNALDQ